MGNWLARPMRRRDEYVLARKSQSLLGGLARLAKPMELRVLAFEHILFVRPGRSHGGGRAVATTVKRTSSAIFAILPHNNSQRPPTHRDIPLQRTQLRHSRHQTGILTLHPDLIPDPDLLPLVHENIVCLVVEGLPSTPERSSQLLA